jgi:hypothetical protein
VLNDKKRLVGIISLGDLATSLDGRATEVALSGLTVVAALLGDGCRLKACRDRQAAAWRARLSVAVASSRPGGRAASIDNSHCSRGNRPSPSAFVRHL